MKKKPFKNKIAPTPPRVLKEMEEAKARFQGEVTKCPTVYASPVKHTIGRWAKGTWTLSTI